MNIVQIYEDFPTKESCIKHLEKVKWDNQPSCPYCKSKSHTKKPKHYYHCNACNTPYTVTVNTIFHSTKLDLRKWFVAISLVLNAKKGISARQLARDINVNKDTAWYMMMRLRKSMLEQGPLLEGIVEADETYIGGKEKNKHKSKKTKGSQGRCTKTKTPVAGAIQRDGKVVVKKVKDTNGKTLKSFLNSKIEKGSKIMTDEWKAYRGLSKNFEHFVIKHNQGQYVNGRVHTNTIEGFWSLLKRGIMGQYHWLSAKHLDKYITEFCYRYNHRNNKLVFNLTIQKALGL